MAGRYGAVRPDAQALTSNTYAAARHIGPATETDLLATTALAGAGISYGHAGDDEQLLATRCLRRILGGDVTDLIDVLGLTQVSG